MSILVLIVILALFVGTIYLQMFLSKKDSAWLGLILPILFFLASLIVPFGMMAPENGVTGGFLLSVLLVFLLANIPTIILISVYFACREKQQRKNQLDKMSIQDLG